MRVQRAGWATTEVSSSFQTARAHTQPTRLWRRGSTCRRERQKEGRTGRETPPQSQGNKRPKPPHPHPRPHPTRRAHPYPHPHSFQHPVGTGAAQRAPLPYSLHIIRDSNQTRAERRQRQRCRTQAVAWAPRCARQSVLAVQRERESESVHVCACALQQKRCCGACTTTHALIHRVGSRCKTCDASTCGAAQHALRVLRVLRRTSWPVMGSGSTASTAHVIDWHKRQHASVRTERRDAQLTTTHACSLQRRELMRWLGSAAGCAYLAHTVRHGAQADWMPQQRPLRRRNQRHARPGTPHGPAQLVVTPPRVPRAAIARASQFDSPSGPFRDPRALYPEVCAVVCAVVCVVIYSTKMQVVCAKNIMLHSPKRAK